jgi:AraC-like DNA-binding protein
MPIYDFAWEHRFTMATAAGGGNPQEKLPKAELHLATTEQPDAFDIWHAALAPLFDVSLEGENATAAFRGDVTGFHLGDCLTFNNASVSQRLVRSHALARRSDTDHIMIQSQTAGHYKADYSGRTVELRPGDIGFYDFGRTSSSLDPDFTRITLIVPRNRLPARFRERNLHGVVLDGAKGSTRLLAGYMKSLFETAEQLTTKEAAAAVDAVFLLADGAWEASRGMDPEQQAVCRTTLQLARSYIDEHLTKRKLGPESIAAALHLSRTTLYRLFAEEGGIHAYITARRLDRCFDAIVNDRARRISITETAFAHGFNSEAHFSRAFRARFGASPSEVRGLVKSLVSARVTNFDPSATIYDWVARLGISKPTTI